MQAVLGDPGRLGLGGVNVQAILGDPGSLVKNLPAMLGTWVQSLGREVPLEKEMAIHSSILVWEIPQTEELGGLQSIASQRLRHDRVTNTHILHYA